MPAGKIYSFKTMRDQVLTAIRQTGDATGIRNVNAWLNEQFMEYAAKWVFPELVAKWRTTISQGAQPDPVNPFIIRNVPRDMVKIMEAKILDENVSPIEWFPLEIRSMNEFERKFYNADLKQDPDIPRDIALFIKEGSVFPGGGTFLYSQGFETLALVDLDGQDGWGVTGPNYSVGTVSTTNPITGAQSLSFDVVDDVLGFPYRRDVPTTTRSVFRFAIQSPVSPATSTRYQVGVSDGLDPTANQLLTGLAGMPWSVDLIWGPTGFLSHLFNVDGTLVGTPTTLNTNASAIVEVEIDENALVTFRIDGIVQASATTTQPTVSRLHVTGRLTLGASGTAVIDDLVYDDTSVEKLFPNGMQVRSTDATEDADLRVGANLYTTDQRSRIEKFETLAAPALAAVDLFAGQVFGVIGVGKSENSKGIIIYESRDTIPVLIAELMPWEISATFLTIQLNPFPDAIYELHLTYQRSPPIMVNDSDNTFLLPALLQGAIIEGAIVRGLKYNEDFQAAAAAAVVQQQKEADFVAVHFPELIEESHTYIAT
ncbi:hypothetical protein LCGC14_0450840 [marine sediment metagenome]|uniref:Uncharacterized protein n=1 Tax=marine sediment metagenome TaxID=412755 RepID=A0A0F9VRR0_9ZZZZ